MNSSERRTSNEEILFYKEARSPRKELLQYWLANILGIRIKEFLLVSRARIPWTGLNWPHASSGNQILENLKK